MTLKEYRKFINELIKDGHGDKEVYYACDDEGNSFQPLTYKPSIIKASLIDDMGRELSEREVVCIN